MDLARNSFLSTALLLSFFTFALGQQDTQQPAAPSAQLVLSGKIKVNDKPVAAGFAIANGDHITTEAKSSAVVSLGKLGRVEVWPSSDLRVTFDDTSLNVDLDAGAVRVLKAEGMTATVSTKDGAVLVNSPLAGSFTVDMDCGNTLVTSNTVAVDVRSLDDHKITITPRNHASVGTPRAKCRPRPMKLR